MPSGAAQSGGVATQYLAKASLSDSILFNSAMLFPGSSIRMIRFFDKPAKGILLGVMYNSDDQAIELNSADSNEIWLEAVDYAGLSGDRPDR